MENRDYLKMFGEDCDSEHGCDVCEVKELCRKEIEESHGIKISEEETED